jgi:hypothetical protein
LGRVAQDFIEKERLKGARFDYSEISIFYVFSRLLTGRTVLIVIVMIPGNAKPMKYSVKWRFLDARRQRYHRRPYVAGRSFASSFVFVFPIRLAPGKITTSTGKISVPTSCSHAKTLLPLGQIWPTGPGAPDCKN